MLLALGILLVALVAAVLKDWDFWFPANEEAEYATGGAGKRISAAPGPAQKASPATEPSAGIRERKPAKTAEAVSGRTPLAATTERAALPPLQVEVVAGNQRKTVPGKSNAIHVDVGSPTSPSTPPPPPQGPVVSAADQVHLSPQTAQTVSRPVAPDYPLLARQMKVQGAVILQALISRDGSIQELQVLSGPGILATAAREAVRQWHFKPYYQNGQPVETQARITVNFTISTN